MKQSRSWGVVFTVLVCALASTDVRAGDGVALEKYAGEGLILRVLESSATAGTVRGEIVREGSTYPFTGERRRADGTETMSGTFKAGDSTFEFSARKDALNGGALLFTTGGTTYRLIPENNPPQPANPLAKREIGQAATIQQAPGVLRLKRHDFPDATMGAPAAYTALMPDDWSAQGQIEWQPVGELPFPQLKIEITSPQKGRIRYLPQMTISYMESPTTGRQGIPPPQDFPTWIAEAIAQRNLNLSNVKLVNSHRNTEMEKFQEGIDRATRAVTNGMQREVHVIVVEYDEDGIRRREEMNLTYVRFQPFNGINGFNSQTWSIFNGGSICAPAEQFDAQRTTLLNVASTIRPTPQWYTHSQAIIADNSRKRAERVWESIRERGRQINQISDADYTKYKTDMHSGEEQRKRINGIYETDDFKDSDGSVVNLPMHYQHVFSDGKGHYVLSNNSQDKPGELWTPIEPAK
jgi:hypothetical protein